MFEMSEEPLIRRKLLLDGDGTGDDKRLQVFIKQMTKWVFTEESPDECQTSYNRLLSQLHSLELNRKKFDLQVQCYTRQMKHFKVIQRAFENRIAMIKNDIDKQQSLLKRAKVVKKNYIEYDLLVKTINKQPCRKELQERIDNLKEEIVELENAKDNLSNKLNSKVKQCHVLSTSANTLKYILEEEEYGEWDTMSYNSEAEEHDIQMIE